jgi:hypothetical protein
MSMPFPRALGCAAVLLFPLAACGAPADPFPPPGLYRVESDGSMTMRGGTIRSATDAATASGVVETHSPGRPSTRQTVAGEGPKNICMPARAANGGLPLPASSCRGGAPVVGPNGVTYSAACGFADITTLVRKLDSKTWEYKVTSVEHLGAAGAGALPDFSMQRKMFEQSARSAPTAAERADAASVLANWAEYEAEARANAAEAGNLPQQGRARQEERKSTLVTRLTRIADTCPSAGARPAGR